MYTYNPLPLELSPGTLISQPSRSSQSAELSFLFSTAASH